MGMNPESMKAGAYTLSVPTLAWLFYLTKEQ